MSEGIKRQVQESFAKHANKYVTSATHAKGEDLALIVEWVQPEARWLTLDIATGGGHVANKLAEYVQQVFATDLTKEMLANTARHLHDKKNISYVLADAEELPFMDEYFDFVTCRIAPHHFPNPEQFISEVSRVLKPNGKFVLIDNVAPEQGELATFMNTFEKMRDPSHVRALPVSEWQKLCKHNRLSIVKSRLRKKEFDYQDWVSRILETEESMEQVSYYIQQASEEKKQYFDIKEEEKGHIQSLAIDEWMVLCEKIE